MFNNFFVRQNQDQGPKENNAAGSRFSQWFKRESPTKSLKNLQQFDSRRSSLHDELNNLIGGKYLEFYFSLKL